MTIRTVCQCCGETSKLGYVAVCPACFYIIDSSNIVFGKDARKLFRSMQKSERIVLK